MRTEFFTSIFATLSALLLAAALPVLADDADGKPDLYELSQNGKKLYLFGTFHLLPAELEWQKPVLVDKIAASSRFFMEQDLDAPDYEDAAFAALGRFLQRDSGQGDLAAELGNFYFERLVRLFGDDPGLRRQIAIQPPWYMSINVGLQAVNDAGLELGAGAEEWLAAEIAARGGDIEGLESADEALTAIASGSRAQQVSGWSASPR